MSATEETTAGNYFVSNYPPFSVLEAGAAGRGAGGARTPARPGTPLGLYLHIPFCRKRCHFCYFKVYTDKDADSDQGLPRRCAIARVPASMRPSPFLGGRKPQFVYFGGGTPSYLSESQLRQSDGPDEGPPALGRGGGSHVRVRAGHADRPQAARPSATSASRG